MLFFQIYVNTLHTIYIVCVCVCALSCGISLGFLNAVLALLDFHEQTHQFVPVFHFTVNVMGMETLTVYCTHCPPVAVQTVKKAIIPLAASCFLVNWINSFLMRPVRTSRFHCSIQCWFLVDQFILECHQSYSDWWKATVNPCRPGSQMCSDK